MMCVRMDGSVGLSPSQNEGQNKKVRIAISSLEHISFNYFFFMSLGGRSFVDKDSHSV